MNRSPLFYPLNRGMDADAGGAADLQTDVMRFMAIISMCLVAVFALVQSIPLAPLPPAGSVSLPAPEAVVEEPESEKPAYEVPADVPAKTIALVRPAPQKTPPPEESVRLDRPVARPAPRQTKPPEPQLTTSQAMVESSPMPAPVAQSSSTSSTRPQGFTLRFESDTALTRLVERDVVGLYVISDASIHRMAIDSGALSFWPASAPQRFHEMDVATVPATVLNEWRRGHRGGDVKWGVSIPAPMARDLNAYLSDHEGGSLVIGRDGQLRLEQ